MKKLIVVAVFFLAVISLSSCRSKKNGCSYSKVDTIEKTQDVQHDVVEACIEE